MHLAEVNIMAVFLEGRKRKCVNANIDNKLAKLRPLFRPGG